MITSSDAILADNKVLLGVGDGIGGHVHAAAVAVARIGAVDEVVALPSR